MDESLKKPRSRELPNEVRIRLSHRTSELIESECEATPYETGGVLLGHLRETDSCLEYEVTHAAPPGYDSVSGFTSFTRGPGFAKQRLDYLALKFGIHYLGEWHKHTSQDTPRASEKDLRTMRRIARNPSYDIAFPLLVVANESGRKLTIYVCSSRTAKRVRTRS